MKALVRIFLATFVSIHSLAAPLPPGTLVPIAIKQDDGRLFHFEIQGTYAPQDFQKGEIYFFQNGDKVYQGTNRGVKNGVTQWSDIEEVPVSEQDPRENPRLTPNSEKSPKAERSDSHDGALGSAIQSGIAHAIYNGIIFTPDFMEEMNRLNEQINSDNQATIENYDKIRAGIQENQIQFQKSLEAFQQSLNEMKTSITQKSSIDYQSSDKDFVSELKELEGIFKGLRTGNPVRQTARSWGLKMIADADQASARDDSDSASAFKKYAETFADLAVGLDPITGPIRDTYEAFTGKNLITGEELAPHERAFAVFGAVSFGFGSKIGKGLKVLAGINKTSSYIAAIGDVEKLAAHAVREARAESRASYYRYIQWLRQKMERPNIKDPVLKEFIEERLWKDGSTVANGSTMAAIRHEVITGQSVHGRLHSQKGQNSVTKLKRWLVSNPNAAESDKRAVGHIIEDLESALRGEYHD